MCGFAAPSSGGLFGSTTTATSAAAAPSSSGLFGSTPAAPAPAFGGFGNTTTTPAAAPAPSTNTSLFGSTTQQQQQQQPLYYTTNPTSYNNPQQAALHAHQSASQRQEAARIEEATFNLHSKYSPYASDPINPALGSNNVPSSLCAFTAILYDPLPPQHRVTTTTTAAAPGGLRGGGHLSAPKPSHISNQVWNEALARNPNPNELMPISLVGAPSLHSRLLSQQQKATELQSHAQQLRSTLTFLEHMARKSQNHIQYYSSTQMELNRKLLQVMRKVEIIRCMNQPTQRAEEEAQFKLRKLVEQVNIVRMKLCDLEERGRQQARNWRRMRGEEEAAAAMNTNVSDGVSSCGGSGELLSSSSSFSTSLSDEDKLALFHVLNDQRLGMERLGSIVTRDVRDTEILKEEMSKAESSSSSSVRGITSGRMRVGGSSGGGALGPAIFGGR